MKELSLTQIKKLTPVQAEKYFKKMDHNLISSKQAYEISYLQKAYGIPAKRTRAVMKELDTVSREKIYDALRGEYPNLP